MSSRPLQQRSSQPASPRGGSSKASTFRLASPRRQRGVQPPPQPSSPRRQIHTPRRGELTAWPAQVAVAPAPPRPSTSSSATPALLGRLRETLERELLLVRSHDAAAAATARVVSQEELQVYRDCFERLIAEFKTYGPLLSSIKSAYDNRVSACIEQIEELKPLALKMEAMHHEQVEAVHNVKVGASKQLTVLRARIAELEDGAEGAARDRKALQDRLEEEQENVASKEAKVQELLDMNRDFSKSIKKYEAEAQKRRSEGDGIHEALWKCKSQYADLLEEYNIMLDENNSKGQLVDETAQLVAVAEKREFKTAQKLAVSERVVLKGQADITKIKKQYRDARKKLGAQHKLQIEAQSRPKTPRPKWDELNQQVPALQIDLEQPSMAIAREVGERILDLRLEWQAAAEVSAGGTDGVRGAPADVRQLVDETPKFFVGRGTGPKVPKYLRWQGKVQNTKLPKRDTEAVIKEFWRLKIKHDARGVEKGRPREDMQEYFYNFLKSKFGIQAKIIEFAYNFVDALAKFQYDADCELFNKVLSGQLCEDAYHEQVALMDGLQTSILKADKSNNGGRVSGSIGRVEFLKLILKRFPFKTDDDHAALKAALAGDTGMELNINYKPLFGETKDGDQSKFVETLRDQQLYEVLQVYTEIEDAVRRVVARECNGEAFLAPGEVFEAGDSEGSFMVTFGHVRHGISDMDDAMPSAVIERVVLAGIGTGATDGPPSDFREVALEDFMIRVRSIVIHRYSKSMAEAEAARQARFVRSLPPNERRRITEVFKEMDRDHSGALDKDELGELLEKTYGMTMTDDELAKLLEEVDEGGDGHVSLNEFMTGMATVPALKYAGQVFEWRIMFQRFDTDDSGEVDGEEVKELVLDVLGDDADDEDVAQLLELLANDDDDDGVVDGVTWEQFLSAMSLLDSDD